MCDCILPEDVFTKSNAVIHYMLRVNTSLSDVHSFDSTSIV